MLSRFKVQIGKNLAMSLTYFYIKKRYTFFIGFVGKLNTGIKLIKTFQKNLKFFCTMRLSSMYQNIKILSMYLNHTKGYNCCVSRKLPSNLSMKRHAYGGANLVPVAIPGTCCLILLLNSK